MQPTLSRWIVALLLALLLAGQWAYASHDHVEDGLQVCHICLVGDHQQSPPAGIQAVTGLSPDRALLFPRVVASTEEPPYVRPPGRAPPA